MTVRKWGPWAGGAAAGLVAVIWLAVGGLDKLDIIDRHAFEWGDFSTLATGFFAVLGAAWVGSKQVGISHSQTTIMRHQVELEILAFKSNLYDKRMNIYSTVKQYVSHCFTDEDQFVSKLDDFLLAIESSEFLFNETVAQGIRDIYGNILLYRVTKRKLDSLSDKDQIEKYRKLHDDHIDTISVSLARFASLVRPYLAIDELTPTRT